MPSRVKPYRKLMKSDLWPTEPFTRFQDGSERSRSIQVDVKPGRRSRKKEAGNFNFGGELCLFFCGLECAEVAVSI